MSDFDGLNLAGVIGTWVAVFLAIVALVGILPVALLYRQSRTEKAQALALLDDPSGDYIINTFKLANFRIRKIGKVTNLVSPPDLGTLEYEPEWKAHIQNESTSGWINFLYTINAMFPSRPDTNTDGDDRNVLFENGETFLLVHRAWILALAVVHCYAYRQDYGLPKGNISQDHIERFPWKNTLAGISGGLFKHRIAEDYYRLGNQLGKVTFIIHPRSTPTVLEEKLDIKDLMLLFFGFVKMLDGTYVRAAVGENFKTRGEWRRVKPILIAQLQDDTTNLTESNLFTDMNIQVSNIKKIETQSPGIVFQDRSKVWNADDMRTKGYMKLGEYGPLNPGRDIWMDPTDVYRLSAGYLSTPFRRQGFLYDNGRDLIVSKMFSWKHTTTTLKLGQQWVTGLDVDEAKTNLLRVGLGKALDCDLTKASWSREAMQSLYELDQAILAACKSSDWKFRSISVLFACKESFRVRLAKELDRKDIAHRQIIRLSIRDQKVELRGSEEMGGQHKCAFQFDFMSVFGFDKPPADNDSENLPTAQAVFAAIQGQIRAAMWKMSLSSRGARDFLYDNLYYVSTRPARYIRNLERQEVLDSMRNRSVELVASAAGSSSSVAGSSPSDSGSGIEEIMVPRPQPFGTGGTTIPGPRPFGTGGTTIPGPRPFGMGGIPIPGPHPFDSRRVAVPSVPLARLTGRRRLLTSHEPKSETFRDEMPLHAAARQGDEAGVRQWIERGFNKNAKNSDGETALFLAAKNGDLLIVKYLESIGADLEVRDATDTTALGIAAIKGQLSVVRFLLDKGADSEVRDDTGSTALSWAAYEGEKSVVEVLLQHGSDKDTQDDDGRTPLYGACNTKQWEVAEVLLHNGADCNKAMYIGNAPLHEAAEHGKTSIVQLLLQKGADISRKDPEGKTAMQIALWQNHEAIYRLLEEWKNKEREKQDVDGGRENNLGSPSLLQETKPGNAHDLP